MDENKNNSQINGFDSANRGYTVTPDGGFFEQRSESVPPTEDISNTAEGEPQQEGASFVDAVFETPVEEQAFEPKTAPEEAVSYEDIYGPSYPPKKPKKQKDKKYGRGVVIASVFLAAVIGATSGVGAMLMLKDEMTATPPADTQQNSAPSNTTINVEKVSDSVIEAVAEKASPGVVGIRTTMAVTSFFGGSEDYTGEGSGIIYSTDGYIITNYHVLESAIESSSSKIEVFLNEDTTQAHQATLIGYNISNDLAVLKIEQTGLPALELGDSDNLKRGQFVAAIGCPGGLNFIGSVSYGIISGLNRTVNASTQEAVSLIQTDAAINPGNSGGALLDIEGKLIGVNSSKIASTEYEGMGFAIPVNSVKEICDQIIARKDDPTPYVGITLSETYNESTLNRLGYPSGAVVSAVDADGPAHESGIRRGDIITRFGDTDINNYNTLYTAISSCSVGDTVKVKIYRAGRYYETELKVTSNNAK